MDAKKCKIFWMRMKHEQSQEFYKIQLNLYIDGKEKKNADAAIYSWDTGACIKLEFQTHFEKGRWVEPYNTGASILPYGNAEDVREGLMAIARFLGKCGWDGWNPNKGFMETVKMLKRFRFAEVAQDIHWHSAKAASEYKGNTYYCLEYRNEEGITVHAGSCYLPENATLQDVQAEVVTDCMRRLRLTDSTYLRDNIMEEIAKASRTDLYVQLAPHYDLAPFFTLDSILKELDLKLDPEPADEAVVEPVSEDV